MQGHAFISYVREDEAAVKRLQHVLEQADITVWRDRTSMRPGLDWEDEAAEAIENAVVFLACFSNASEEPDRTSQRAELKLAIEELRQRRHGQPWLIPVRLSDVPLPRYSLGSGKTLAGLNAIDLFGDRWKSGCAQLIETIHEVLGSTASPPPDRRPPLWRRWPSLLAALAAVTVALGSVIAWQARGDPTDHAANSAPTTTTSTAEDATSTSRSPTTTVPTTSPPTTAPPALPTTTDAQATCPTSTNDAQIDLFPGVTPQLIAASYEVDDAKAPFVDIAGQLEAQPAAGQVFVVDKTADPATTDSTPDHNPGSTGHFPRAVNVDEDGCWAYWNRPLAYECGGGVTFVFHFLVMPQATSQQLAADAAGAGDDGLTQDEVLGRSDVIDLGSISVDTTKHPDCPG